MKAARAASKTTTANTVPNGDRPRQIYFFDRRNDERFVYVGFNGSNRIADHRLAGERLLAVMPGGKDFEGRIHRYFRSIGAAAGDDFATSTSTFEGPEIWAYVEWLLRRGYAATDEQAVDHFPSLPYRVINPKNVTPYDEDDHGQLSLVPALLPISDSGPGSSKAFLSITGPS